MVDRMVKVDDRTSELVDRIVIFVDRKAQPVDRCTKVDDRPTCFTAQQLNPLTLHRAKRESPFSCGEAVKCRQESPQGSANCFISRGEGTSRVNQEYHN
jgi:hypothetical protein